MKDERAAVASELHTVLARVKQLAPGSFRLADGDDFLRELDMDSIDAVELTIELDAVFDVGFGQEPDDVDCLKSFGSLVDLVLARGRTEAVDVGG